jgi:hypothetical protein
VDALRPGEKDSYLWDGGYGDALPGFGVKVTPAGRKVYLIQYRLGGRKGRTRRVTIGTHGTTTAEKARARAKVLLGEMAGRDGDSQDFTSSQNNLSASLVRAQMPGHKCSCFPILVLAHFFGGTRTPVSQAIQACQDQQ